MAASSVSPTTKPAIVLSFAHLEGTRCLESLYLMQELGCRILAAEGREPTEAFFPHEYFQFCGGQGSGAMLAVMFGVFGWCVRTAITHYNIAYPWLIPDDEAAEGPEFEGSSIMSALLNFQENGRASFHSPDAPMPTVIFARFADQTRVNFRTWDASSASPLSVSQIMLASLARCSHFGKQKLDDGNVYNDQLNTDSHVTTLSEADSYFGSQQKTAMLVTIGGQPFCKEVSAVDQSPMQQLERVQPQRRRLISSVADLMRSIRTIPRSWVGRGPAPLVSGSASQLEATVAMSFEGHSSHFALTVDGYNTAGTDIGDMHIVDLALQKACADPDNLMNAEFDECARRIVQILGKRSESEL
jgi:hypothetical protein